MRSLLNLRQILAVGIGALVIPEQIAVPRAMDAFEADGSLKDKGQQELYARAWSRRSPSPRGNLPHERAPRPADRRARRAERRGGARADRDARRQRRRLQDRARAAVLRRLRAGARAGRPRPASVFVDAKLLDIEATVERATAAIARTGVAFLTVHALDSKTLDAAVRGRARQPLEAARRHGAHQSRARRSDRAGHRPSAARAGAASRASSPRKRLRRRDRLGP